MLQLLHRPAESDGAFTLFATTATLAEARDELALPVGTIPHHGDLARVVGDGVDDLHVFDTARSSFIEVPSLNDDPFSFGSASTLPWASTWEGAGANAQRMLRLCVGVDRRRIVRAACDCAETALRYVPTGEDRPRIAIETARRWSRGQVFLRDVMAAWGASIQYVNSLGRGLSPTSAAAVAAATAALCAEKEPGIFCNRASAAARFATTAFAFAAENEDEFVTHSRRMALLVRRHVPLSVLACGIVGAADPLPLHVEA